jgi:hypothetical protein
MDPGSAQAIGWLALTAAGAAGAANQVLKLMDRFKEKPPPADTYVTIKECKAMHSTQESRIGKLECEVTAIRTEIKSMGEDLDRKDEARAVAIHNRLNDILEKLSLVRGQIGDIHK